MVIQRINKRNKSSINPEIEVVKFDVEDVIATSTTHSFPFNLTCSCGCGWNSHNGVKGIYHGRYCIGEACVAAWTARGYQSLN